MKAASLRFDIVSTSYSVDKVEVTVACLATFTDSDVKWLVNDEFKRDYEDWKFVGGRVPLSDEGDFHTPLVEFVRVKDESGD